jgi:hypothetical protein
LNEKKNDKGECITKSNDPTKPFTDFMNQYNSSRSSKSSSSKSSSYSSKSSSYSNNSSNIPKSYKKEQSEFGKKYKNNLKPTENNKFSAVYLDQSKQNPVIDTEIVDRPAMNYAWSDFKNIKSEDFAAYYFGSFKFEKTTVKEISVSQSWADTKIYIDEFLVFDGKNNNQSFVYEFTPGTHTMEVEYQNNWHTVGFSVQILDTQQTYNLQQSADLVNKNLSDYNLFYVGAYESNDRNGDITLNMTDQNKPAVLLVSSYEAINWNIIGSGASQVKYIIYNSYSPKSSFSGNTKDIKFLPISDRDLPYEYSVTPRCGGGSCEDKGLVKIHSKIKSIFNKEISGFSGSYNPTYLNVPEQTISPDDWIKYENEANQINTSSKSNGNCIQTMMSDGSCR